MERNDFISGDAYYRYKFERESKNEEIQRLRTKMERMRTDNYVRVAYDSVVITVLVAFIAFLLVGRVSNDLQYRLASRTAKTSLGRPLYYRINVQMITTQECPFHCPFCLERQNPMSGDNDFDAQIEALKRVLQEHPNARLSITGGEPGLYPKHIANIVETYRKHGNGVFCSINTTGFSTELNGLAHINLSRNDYVWTDPAGFPGCTVQTVVENPTLAFIKDYMKMDASSFSFRFLSGLEKKDYPVDIWNDLQQDADVDVHTFRIGDFFVYATFDYAGKHARVTLGDMWQQRHNNYGDGYSNIIIHPDGRVSTNWR